MKTINLVLISMILFFSAATFAQKNGHWNVILNDDSSPLSFHYVEGKFICQLKPDSDILTISREDKSDLEDASIEVIITDSERIVFNTGNGFRDNETKSIKLPLSAVQKELVKIEAEKLHLLLRAKDKDKVIDLFYFEFSE